MMSDHTIEVHVKYVDLESNIFEVLVDKNGLVLRSIAIMNFIIKSPL